MLRLQNISTGYGKKQVLFDISLEIKEGDTALLIGSNGSGKSTLLKTIFNINIAWNGSIYFQDEEITRQSSNTLLKKGLMYVPQKNNVFEQLTIKENMEISGLSLNNITLFRERYKKIMKMFPDLSKNINHYPMKMSGGERQQLVLSMALMHQPKFLLLDEPLTGLDPKSIEQIISTIGFLRSELNITILIVEHRIKEALPLANQLIGLKLGKVVENTLEMSKFDLNLIQKILI